MANRKQVRLAEIAAFVAGRRVERIAEAEFAELKLHLKVGEPVLRRLLRDTTVPLAPIIEGVRQETFDALERTLVQLATEYEASDRNRRQSIRRLVITAKEHARFAARAAKAAGKKLEKEEMVQWMLVWLENPAIFAPWAKLRRRTAAGAEVASF